MKKGMTRLLALALCGALLAVPVLAAEQGAYAQWQLTPNDPAAFTDAAEIGQWEAVAALARLGVIAGKDNGAFDPAAEVTRAEAAKLMYYARMGTVKAEIPTESPSSFTDMEGHWARAAAEYCQVLGILEGRGDGTFDPDAAVTGSEFCKMALVALGYDPTVFGLTGDNWMINTNARANAPGISLYAGLTGFIDPTVPITRDVAAQILTNMLKATVLEALVITDDEEAGEPYTKYVEKQDENGVPVSFLALHFGLTELPETPQQPEGK